MVKSLQMACLIIIYSVISLYSAMIDDFEDGDNRNEMGYYWRYFVNGCDSDVVIRNAASGQDGVTYMKPTAGKGHDEGFTAELSWTFNPKQSVDCSNRFVSLCTNFCADFEKGAQWSNATAISFYAKASCSLTIRIQLTTFGYSGGGIFFKIFTVNNQWNKYTVKFSELKKSELTTEHDFLNTELYEMQLDIVEDFKGTPAIGALYIDDFEVDDSIVSYRYNLSTDKPGFFSKLDGTILADFESTNINTIQGLTLSKFNTMWYLFDDSKIAGKKNSFFTSGTIIDSNNSTATLNIITGNGDGYDSSQGLKIAFKLGSSISKNDTIIKPFVGIGCMLSNSDRYKAGVDTFLSTTDAADGLGIYFDFKCESNNSKFNYFEVAFFDTDTLPDGISFSHQLPITNGVWRSAAVLFDDISLPYWPEKIDPLSAAQRSLDLTKLEKIEFRFQNVKNVEAVVYLDNFRFFGYVVPPDILHYNVVSRLKHYQLQVTTKMNVHGLMVTLKSPFTEKLAGVVELLRVNGRVIYTEKMSTAGNGSLLLKTDKIANGVYIIKINASSGNGKKYFYSNRITVLN